MVREATVVIDPAWAVSVRQTGSLLAREWEVGCINGDDPANSFSKVEWVNRRTFKVHTRSDVVAVKASATGKPAHVRGAPWGAC